MNLDFSESAVVRLTEALPAVGRKRAAPLLVALMYLRVPPNRGRDAALAKAVAATGEPRAIPNLIGLLDRTKTFHTLHAPPKEGFYPLVTTARADAPLMALVKLTGQDPAAYGFERIRGPMVLRPSDPADYGFRAQHLRISAIEKFKNWWKANKHTATYRGLKPLRLPRIKGAREMPRRPPQGSRALR
jgi:hypothetical protein